MKILLVDDERTEREGIRFLIEKFQFELEVAEAANGKLAMEYLQKYQDVDILLTDVKMPYMDGLQLAKYAKEVPTLELVAGVVEDAYYDKAGIEALSKVPSREELLGKLLGSIQSPITNFARVLNQIAEQQGGAAAE